MPLQYSCIMWHCLKTNSANQGEHIRYAVMLYVQQLSTHFCPACPFFRDGLSFFCLKLVKLVSSCFVGDLHSHYTVYSSADTTTVCLEPSMFANPVFQVEKEWPRVFSLQVYEAQQCCYRAQQGACASQDYVKPLVKVDTPKFLQV